LCIQLILAFQANNDTPSPTVAAIYQIADICFNAVFTLECMMKVIALGWRSTGPSAYILNMWNLSDFVLLVGSLICTSSCTDQCSPPYPPFA
jgi:hypothetical protein